MVKYVHIGYPKCFSTTLQRCFFDAHPQIFHLGIGCGSNVDYADEYLSAAMENYLVYARQFVWQEKKAGIIRHFSSWFEKAQNEGFEAVGVSLEHLGFGFTTDNIDTCDKAHRIKELFGEDTRIVMVIRNQLDLIKSLYRESVRTGNAGNFNDYMQFCVFLKDRNFVYDFRYDLVHDLYSRLFGQENILVLMMEELRSEAGVLITDGNGQSLLSTSLSNFLGIANNHKIAGHYNAALTNAQLLRKRELNKEYLHDLGNPMYGRGVSFHRLNDYLQLEFPNMLTEEFIYADVLTKRKLINMSTSKDASQEIEHVDSWMEDYLQDFYQKGNEAFEKQLGRKLPHTYLAASVGA